MWLWEPCGFCCFSVSQFLVLYADVVLTFGLFTFYSPIRRLLATCAINFLAFMAVWAHVRTATSDPGHVAKIPGGTPQLALHDFAQRVPGLRRCAKCDGPKPPKAHHCSICNRCVVKMDHHCPWINNCVGFYNQKHFVLFLVYVFLMSIFTVGALSMSLVNCKSMPPPYNHAALDVDWFARSPMNKMRREDLKRKFQQEEQLRLAREQALMPQADVSSATSGPAGPKAVANPVGRNRGLTAVGPKAATDDLPRQRQLDDQESPNQDGDTSLQLLEKSVDGGSCEIWNYPRLLVCCVFLGIEAMIFGLFSFVMTCDQLSNIYSDTTAIEHLQRQRVETASTYPQKRPSAVKGRRGSKRALFSAIFGGPLSWRWLVPLPVPRISSKRSMEDTDFTDQVQMEQMVQQALEMASKGLTKGLEQTELVLDADSSSEDDYTDGQTSPHEASAWRNSLKVARSAATGIVPMSLGMSCEAAIRYDGMHPDEREGGAGVQLRILDEVV